jgi:hypothetical protein
MMPHDVSGAFSRGGTFFFFLLSNAFVAQSELPAFMEGRRVLENTSTLPCIIHLLFI